MKRKISFKDVDFFFTAALLLVWGASVIGMVVKDPISSVGALGYGVVWVIAAVESWKRWRSEIEDERVRQIILTSGYLTRQIVVLAVLAIMVWPAARESLNSLTWPLLLLALLLLPDLVIRRYLGLKSDELGPEPGPLMKSVNRIVLAVSAVMLVAAAALSVWTWRAFHESFDTDRYDGPAIKEAMKEYEAGKAAQKDARPLSELSDEELKARGIRRVPKRPKPAQGKAP